MNPFNINPLAMLRRRLGAVLGAFAFSACCGLTGALLAFVAAPRQALQANHMAHLPPMDAAGVAAAAPGDEILISGVVGSSGPPPQNPALLAYTDEQWQVSVPTPGVNSTAASPSGQWQLVRTVAPELTLALNGQTVTIQAASSADLSGPLHESVVKSNSPLAANDNGQRVPNGSHRYRGLAAGDLTTVWGTKGAGLSVAPKALFLGDRTAFEASQTQSASGLLFSGLCALALAPLVLIGGLVGVVFWRR